MGHLKIESLTKAYRSLEVLKGIDLEVKEGEFVVFVGPSGCGKSTLLRSVAGLEDVSSGRILLDGRDITALPPAKRGIAMVFQTYALYPHLTVRANMALGLKQAGASADTIAKEIARAATMLSLEPYLARLPAELSGGQRQRVAIGRAIVRDPTLFLFDEPLSNLDAALRVQMRLEIAALHRRLGASMVYVTHDQVEAMTLAYRIVVLRAGAIEQIGSPMELYNNPRNLFVASFLGSPQMNMIAADRLGENGYSTFGIRPEHLDISTDRGDWPGRVVHVERLGADTNVYLESDRLGRVTVRLFGQREIFPGDAVYVSAQPATSHRFDEQGFRVQD